MVFSIHKKPSAKQNRIVLTIFTVIVMYIIFRIIFLVINKNEKNYLSGFSVRISVFVYLFFSVLC